MKKIKLEVEMEDRWVPVFLSFLRTMESNGNIGHSETLAIYADGDGDFRPKFHNVFVDGRHINFRYDVAPNTYHSYIDKINLFDADMIK